MNCGLLSHRGVCSIRSECECLPQRGDEILCWDGSLDDVEHGLTRVFVVHRRNLEFPPSVVESNWKSTAHSTFGALSSAI